jgi:hypothetical protein
MGVLTIMDHESHGVFLTIITVMTILTSWDHEVFLTIMIMWVMGVITSLGIPDIPESWELRVMPYPWQSWQSWVSLHPWDHESLMGIITSLTIMAIIRVLRSWHIPDIPGCHYVPGNPRHQSHGIPRSPETLGIPGCHQIMPSSCSFLDVIEYGIPGQS